MKKLSFCLLALSVLLPLFYFSFAQAQTALPTGTTTLFAGSGVCARCHDGLIDQTDTNVSPVIMWRSTMMGNAAKDPLWRAKVSAEGAELSLLKEAIEKKCISCHAPILYKDGLLPVSIENLVNDPLAKDGDTCTVCHQIQPDNFGLAASFSNGFEIFNIHEIYGPYANSNVGPMLKRSNYTPVLAYPTTSAYVINDSEHCATCHTLFTSYVGADNNLIPGSSFPEQVPYLEWLNSDYPALGADRTCQGCHMPKTAEPIKISTVGAKQMRTPYWYHYFVGGNVFMPNILKNNIDLLGLTATVQHFDSTIFKAQNLLENQTVNLVVPRASIDTVTPLLDLDVRVENLAGHKLPTALPLRRVWIHLKVTDLSNNLVFESGSWDPVTGEIAGLSQPYEPHHNKITREDQVQIYEGIMQDVLGNVTHTLLRAASFVKDNRIPPKGFTKEFAGYPAPYGYGDVAIVGNAATDPNFNIRNKTEGSGTDTVHYEIPLDLVNPPYTVSVEVCYQTVTPGEVAHLSSYGTTETVLFNDLYAQPATDKTPIILKKLTLTVQ